MKIRLLFKSLALSVGLTLMNVPAAPADPLDAPRLVVKHGPVFAVFNPEGMISENMPFGLYKDDTRYLAALKIELNGRPTLLESNAAEGYGASFIYADESKCLLLRRELIIQDGLVERLTVVNYSPVEKDVDLALFYGFDFKDMFEVRGAARREKPGEMHLECDRGNDVVASYIGADKQKMQTNLHFSGFGPGSVNASECRLKFKLKPHQSRSFEYAATPGESATTGYDQSKAACVKDYQKFCSSMADIKTDNESVNKVFDQARRDLFVLRQGGDKDAIAAGLPWYAVPFGRDQIVTAMEMLVFAPDISRQVIDYLADKQGKKYDKYTEEAPGRIMHELRSGELARLKAIPFTPYYGTVDATPLWLVLISRYSERTEDLSAAREHWPQVEAALEYLKKNSDPFLSYGGGTLSNQAWKDSGDSVMYESGLPAKAPITIAEVQGYLYEAWTGSARLARELKKDGMKLDQTYIEDLERRAARLKQSFKEKFYWPEEEFVYLALDGQGQPCKVVASNPGHLLSSGILDRETAIKIAHRLERDDMFSGFGIRTLSSKARAYNPMSYHNGSVWPHDNALITQGMVHYYPGQAGKTASALLSVARAAGDNRLPELFCGFEKTTKETPVPYPVSCSPQAWCTAAPFSLLSSILGIEFNKDDDSWDQKSASEPESESKSKFESEGGQSSLSPQRLSLTLNHPQLPDAVNSVTISNLKVKEGTLTVQVTRGENDTIRGDIHLDQSK